MNTFIKSKWLSKFNVSDKLQGTNNRILLWVIIGVSSLAFLEFGQDYIASVLYNGDFYIIQSLSYKIFWFIFIPITYSLLTVFNIHKWNFTQKKRFIISLILIIFVTLLHLLVFSLCLHIVSYTISEIPWSLDYLITQKLSTRLYLGLFLYIFFFVITHLFYQKTKNIKHHNYLKTLPIKFGGKTTLVKVHRINWIASDGPYLEINTKEKKYVILGSLKKIIHTLPENFRRVHKSTIVNIDEIESSTSRGNGDYDLVLKCEKKIRLSRNYAKPLKGILH